MRTKQRRDNSHKDLPAPQIDLELDIDAPIDPSSEQLLRLVFLRTRLAKQMSFEQAMDKKCLAICIRMEALALARRAAKTHTRLAQPGDANPTNEVPIQDVAEWVSVPAELQPQAA